ncbi:hypothetical protein, unknown function [Leishmania tarentolae]|uniref:Uncharacterized protein n=1 Tax=Leishmania tarentolae TaxID=5689 RepID=A0A640KFS7_LEITA|nr:hypothetical protein, unknown function [Leishmania tarentolae]
MLRFCPLAHAHPISVMTTRTMAVTAALQLQPRRAYVTGARSTARERRYYTQPLRAPQYGTSTIVGRQKSDADASATGLAEAASPMTEEIVTALHHKMDAAHPPSTSRCRTAYESLKMKIVATGRRPVRYNDAGVPVEGSVLLLPWREQLRLCTAILVALYITKTFFDVVRFELLYYGVWKVGYRHDGSLMKRLLYYASTAMLAAGLFLSFNLNFFLSACVVGRREIALHLLCNVFAYVMPRRCLQLLVHRVVC